MSTTNAGKTPVPGKGRAQWDFGAWFGSQFGLTAWLALAAATFAADRQWLVAGVGGGVFVVLAALAYALWARRDRVAPYVALQSSLVAVGLGATLFFAVIRRDGDTSDMQGWIGRSGEPSYGWLLIFPLMLILFHVLERRGPSPRPGADDERDAA